MRKRLRAAWRAFRTPEPRLVIKVTDVGGAAVIDAIRRHQRRRGQPPLA